jgi:hypothetical protein
VSIKTQKGLIPVDTGSIRNLSEISGSDPMDYINGLLEIGRKLEV